MPKAKPAYTNWAIQQLPEVPVTLRRGGVVKDNGRTRTVKPTLPSGLVREQPATHTQAGLWAAMAEIARLHAEIASLKKVIAELNALRREGK